MTAAILIMWVSLLPVRSDTQGLSIAIDEYDHGKFQEARESLSELIKQDPKDAVALMWLGKVCIKLRRYDDAIRNLENAAELDPKKALIHYWLAHAYGEKAAHSFILTASGWARKTVQEFKTASVLAPDDLDVRFDLIDYFLQAPGILGGGRDKAEAQAAEIAKLAPRKAYLARAQIFEDKKDWQRARKELQDAIEKYPDSTGACVDLSGFCLSRRDFECAAANAQKALELDSTNRSARLYRAAAQIQLGRDVKGALDALQTLADGPLTDNDPAFEVVYYWLGRAYLALDRAPEARQAFQASLRFDPDYSRSKQALAQIK